MKKADGKLVAIRLLLFAFCSYFTISTFKLTFNLSQISSSSSLQEWKFNFGGTRTMPFSENSGVPLIGAGVELVSMLSMLIPREAK